MGLKDNMIARIVAAIPQFDAKGISDESLQAKYDEVIAASVAPAAATLVAGASAANALAYAEVPAGDVIRMFRGIEVQTAKPVKVKGEDGVERDAMKTDMVPLAEEHIISAKRWRNGKITITTIDGKRHEAGKRAA